MGITCGLPLADARVLHPGLLVAEADPTGDAAALVRLAAWCGRYSPWTARHGAVGIWLDVTGCAHLRGGEEDLIKEVVERLATQGIDGRAAIADTAGAAWAVARCGAARTTVVPSDGTREMLARLPVGALRLEPVLAVELERLGLRRIGDLYPLPRAALAARFGDAVAHRLDQALGAAPEPLSPLSPAPACWARRCFAEPISTPDGIAAATRELLEALCHSLDDGRLGARCLALTLYRVDGRSERVIIGTVRPSRDSRHLFRLLEEHLMAVDPGFGVEDMVLAATVVEKLAAAQLHLASCQPSRRPQLSDAAMMRLARGILEAEGRNRDGTNEAALAVLVDRLANRLGPTALGCLMPRESHMPERATRFSPVFGSYTSASLDSERLRPIRLLPRPEPIEAMALVPDDPPMMFLWRHLSHRVHRADGPERIAGEWWRGIEQAAELRDYYRVEDDAGRRFWLYRAGLYRPEVSPRWFLHGFFA